MTSDQIEKYTDDMVKDAEAIDANAFDLGWWMRGGVTYNDIMNMSTKQVGYINKIVDDHMETTKKTKMPFF
jgi:hypothetical protein